MNFDSDASTVICDNSANVHVCNDRKMFVDEIRPLASHAVATIGGASNEASGIGTVRWRWKDDTGHEHSHLIANVLYFPNSPINILRMTKFANQLNDDKGTGITTFRRESKSFWDNERYVRTIMHLLSNLPEMLINDGFSLSSFWTRLLNRQFNTSKFHCHCSSLSSSPDKDLDASSMDASPLANELAKSLFHVGETLLYSKDGQSTYAKVIHLDLDDSGKFNIRICTAAGEEITTTRETLREPENPDIAFIPSTVPDYRKASTNLSDEQLESIRKPVKLSPLQEEWLHLHEHLWHLPYSVMFRLVKAGFLPKKFLKLQNSQLPCVSCLFGQAHCKPWRYKSSINGKDSVLNGPNVTQPGQKIGVDQLISAQPGLVPQDKGHLTRARIWAATVFVDYFTKFVYVALMTDQTAESALKAKYSFEHLAGTRDVTVKHYHADNGIFTDTAFRDDCRDSMQGLSLCAVGAHHQNGIVE